MTEDPKPPAGWHPDPHGSDKLRYWDGQQWTQQVKVDPAKAKKGMPNSLKWVIGIGGVALVIAALASGGGEESSDPEPATADKSESAPEPAETEPIGQLSQRCGVNDRLNTRYALWEIKDDYTMPVSEEKRLAKQLLTQGKSGCHKVRRAESTIYEVPGDSNTSTPNSSKPTLADKESAIATTLDGVSGSIEDPNIKDVFLSSDRLKIIVATPEGGFEGASTDDMNRMVAAILRTVYTDASFDGETEIRFTGGLVNSKTGADLPDILTGRYVIRAGEAKQIDWNDEDTVDYVIDWNLFRAYAHEAIK